MQKIFECDNQVILKQYIRCITSITRHDYPEKWPTLLTNDIPTYLNSKNEKGIYTGLVALLALVKKYEFELEDDRKPLFDIQQQCFTILGDLVNQLINNLDNEIALRILHLICKIFYVSNQLQLAPWLMQPGTINPWMHFFKSLLDMQLSPNLS